MRLQHFALAALLSLLAAAASAEDLRKVAETHEQGFVHAIKSKDLSWFQKVAAPDFYVQEANGKKTNKKDSMDEMKQMFGMGNVTAASTKILKLTKIQNGMVVRVKAHMVMNMQSPGSKKLSKMVDDSTYDEKWTKDNGKWMIHSMKTIIEKSTMDGKPMNGM